MRPIGGVLVGHIGDKFGRRTALTFSVTAMAIPTFLMGFLPSYQTIGVLAPIGLILLRVVQGLSVRRMRGPCCARATTGHAAVLPRPAMNVRRLIE